jgi:hypothetical protein
MLGLILAFFGLQSSAAQAQSGSLAGAVQLNLLKLIAAPVGGENLTSRPKYQLNERPVIKISLRNKSLLDVPVQHDNRFFQYQLELWHDGMWVRPRQEIVRMLSEGESGRFSSVRTADPVKPNTMAPINHLNLSDWYNQFYPGHYRLTVKYRIVNYEQVVLTATTDFDVVE